MTLLKIIAVLAVTGLGFLLGKQAPPTEQRDPSGHAQAAAPTRPDWRVPKSSMTVLDTLHWHDELSEHDFHLKLAEALDTMPISNLRALARRHREIAYAELGRPGYGDVQAALLRRTPWIGVGDLLENAEWERSTLFHDDEDLDLEGIISGTLSKLYESEPERVLDVYRNLKSRWILTDTDMFRGFEAESLLAVINAAEESEAAKAYVAAENHPIARDERRQASESIAGRSPEPGNVEESRIEDPPAVPKDIDWLLKQPRLDDYEIDKWSRSNRDVVAFTNAKDALEGLPPTSEYFRAAGQFARNWAKLPGQEKTAVKWAETLSHPGIRHDAVSRAVHSWAESDAVSAANYSVNLEPIELREAAVTSSLKTLIDEDPFTAQAILGRARLTDAMTEPLMKRIEEAYFQ